MTGGRAWIAESDGDKNIDATDMSISVDPCDSVDGTQGKAVGGLNDTKQWRTNRLRLGPTEDEYIAFPVSSLIDCTSRTSCLRDVVCSICFANVCKL